MDYPKTYIKDSKQNGTNRNKDIRILKKHSYKSNLFKGDLKGKGKTKMSISTRTLTIDDTISLERKMEETSHRKPISDTTDKLIAIISQIASRLEHIENNMEILPNRS